MDQSVTIRIEALRAAVAIRRPSSESHNLMTDCQWIESWLQSGKVPPSTDSVSHETL